MCFEPAVKISARSNGEPSRYGQIRETAQRWQKTEFLSFFPKTILSLSPSGLKNPRRPLSLAHLMLNPLHQLSETWAFHIGLAHLGLSPHRKGAQTQHNSRALPSTRPCDSHVRAIKEASEARDQGYLSLFNTDFNHKRVVSSWSPSATEEAVTMVSFPDGLEPGEDRNELGRLTDAVSRVLPRELEALINGNGEFDCVLADWCMPWALEAAEKLGLRRAVFCPAATATMALSFCIPKLVSDGIIDQNGRILKEQMVELAPLIPPFNTTNFVWLHAGDAGAQRAIFNMLASYKHLMIKSTDRIICNSSNILEPGAFSLFPEAKPIGPLLSPHKSINGSFWKQDSTCLSWLDQQPPSSVIYAAFGSFTIFDPKQFLEFALGLELTGRPFLWVMRQDAAEAAGGVELPAGFKERGMVVEWAPQQEVLSHPSVACFVSHCGWNSTIEGASNGVPFLCWPYFADQFTNRDYICDQWKVGLGFEKDVNGIIGREEVKEKVKVILGDGGFKERAVNLREGIMKSMKGGESHANFSNFIHWVKEY